MKTVYRYLFSFIALFASCSKEKRNISVYAVNTTTSQVWWRDYLASDYFKTGTFSVESLLVRGSCVLNNISLLPTEKVSNLW